MGTKSRAKTWEVAACQEGAGFTLREKESGQLMHSRVGPWVEANQVYIAQSELDRRTLAAAGRGPLVIYDVGMGIAANSLAVFAALENFSGPRRPVEIYSFELYPEALAQALESPECKDKFDFLSPFRGALEQLLRTGVASDPRVSWKLVSGDFRVTDLTSIPSAELVYFDFYAPAVCPELWTYAVFSKLYSKMSAEGLLITYASSKAIRSAMLLAGFSVGDGAATPMKLETTVASPTLSAIRKPLTREWLEGLRRSPKRLPVDWPESQREEALARIREHPQFRQ